MKKQLFFFLVPLVFLVQGCPKGKSDFIDKEFLKKGTTEKLTIKIPRKCETFNTGLKVNVDAMVEYAGHDAQLAASFEKVSLISEFSERLKAITAAQCRVLHTSIIIDTNSSDFTLYNDIINKYTEYQKIRDLITSNPSEAQKDEITKTILAVYETLYKNKKDELMDYIKNLDILLDLLPGTQVMIYKNNEFIGAVIGGPEVPTKYIIDKKYLLPVPNETITLRFVASAVGFRTKEITYTLSDLQKIASAKKTIAIELNK